MNKAQSENKAAVGNNNLAAWTQQQIDFLIMGYQMALATERARMRLPAGDQATYRAALEESVAKPAPDARPLRIIYDVSALMKNERVTGIPRVTKTIAHDFVALAAAFGHELIFSNFMKDGFYEVEPAPSDPACLHGFRPTARRVDFRAGDRMIVSDFTPLLFQQEFPFLRMAKQKGVHLTFVIYDLLPILNPQWTEPNYTMHYASWWFHVLSFADRLVAISGKVADDMRTVVAVSRPEPAGLGRPIDLAFFGLGCDGLRREPGTPEIGSALRGDGAAGPKFLAIGGALERRKNLEDLVEAVAILRREGIDASLTITGKSWQKDPLTRYLSDPLWKDRLFIPGHVSDETLVGLLSDADALVSASLDEGFGLPIVEAAHAGVPVILRDLVVHREAAGDEGLYFGVGGPAVIAESLRHFEGLAPDERKAHVPKASLRSWFQSAQQLMAILREDLVYDRLNVSPRIQLNFGEAPLNL